MLNQWVMPEPILTWWNLLVAPAGAFFVVLFVGWVLRKIIFSRLVRWSAKTAWKGDDLILSASRGPFLLWVLIAAIAVAIRVSSVPESIVVLAHKVLLAIWLISLTFVASSLAAKLISLYGDRFQAGLSVTSLTQNVTRIVILGIGILILLNNL